MDSEVLKKLDLRALGDQLKEARRARGLTQEAVAKQLGILRTTLVAIEKGTRRILPVELIELTKTYGRPISEFLAQRANKQPFVPQFRLPPSQTSVTEVELIAAAVELEALARDYVELEELCGPATRPNYLPPQALDVPGVTPEQRGEEVAANERTRLGLGDGPITDLRTLLEEAVGLRVFYLDLPSRVGGIFACNDDLGACIAINRKHPPTRGNWSLAHEYAHFLTTRYMADVHFTHGHWGKLAAERFADSFAKHFLMPRTGVCRRLSDAVQAHQKGVTIGDVMALAHLYRVSAEAMFLRLEELKRLPVGTWDGLRQKRQFRPDQAREALSIPNDPRQPSLPLRYRLLAQSAYDQKELLTEGQLARKLRLDRVSARMELEALRQMANDSVGDSFTPLELDPTEGLVPA